MIAPRPGGDRIDRPHPRVGLRELHVLADNDGEHGDAGLVEFLSDLRVGTVAEVATHAVGDQDDHPVTFRTVHQDGLTRTEGFSRSRFRRTTAEVGRAA